MGILGGKPRPCAMLTAMYDVMICSAEHMMASSECTLRDGEQMVLPHLSLPQGVVQLLECSGTSLIRASFGQERMSSLEGFLRLTCTHDLGDGQ